jgi:hypothetical protein
MHNVHNRLKYGSWLFGSDEKLNMVFAFNYTSTYAYAVNVNWRFIKITDYDGTPITERQSKQTVGDSYRIVNFITYSESANAAVARS